MLTSFLLAAGLLASGSDSRDQALLSGLQAAAIMAGNDVATAAMPQPRAQRAPAAPRRILAAARTPAARRR